MTTTSKNKQQGATAVEFAVVAALLMVILFGILEYALIFLQGHYVENAAREGARVGVRANTYDCYKGEPFPDYDKPGYSCLKDREDIVTQQVADYLGLLYDADDITTTLETEDLDGDTSTDNDHVLKVTVQTENPFTNITPRLLQTLVASSSTQHPSIFRYSATMELEDQDEFDPTNP